jgi:hypothetical protein
MECERISPRKSSKYAAGSIYMWNKYTVWTALSNSLSFFMLWILCALEQSHMGAEAGTLIGCSSSKRPTTCPPAKNWRAGPSRVQGSATAEPIAEHRLWQVQNLHRPLRNHAGPGPVLAPKNRPVTVTSAKQLQTEEMADPYVPRWVLTGSLLIWGWPLQNVTVMKWLMIPVQGGLLAEVLQISGAGAEGSDWWLTRCSATVAHSCHSAAVATGQAKIIGVILCNFELRHRSAIERSWRSEDRLSLGIPSMATDSWLLVDFDDLIWSATCCGKKPRQCEKRLWRFPLLQLGKLNREVLWLEWCANKIQ